MEQVPSLAKDNGQHDTAKAQENGHRGSRTYHFTKDDPADDRGKNGIGGKEHICASRAKPAHGDKQEEVAKNNTGHR